MMQISRTGDLPETSDYELIRDHLPVEGSRLLELGCGTALTTRRLAESLPVREIVAMGESRRTESCWTLTTLIDAGTDVPTAEVLLHQGVFKDSYPGYPTDDRPTEQGRYS